MAQNPPGISKHSTRGSAARGHRRWGGKQLAPMHTTPQKGPATSLSWTPVRKPPRLIAVGLQTLERKMPGGQAWEKTQRQSNKHLHVSWSEADGFAVVARSYRLYLQTPSILCIRTKPANWRDPWEHGGPWATQMMLKWHQRPRWAGGPSQPGICLATAHLGSPGSPPTDTRKDKKAGGPPRAEGPEDPGVRPGSSGLPRHSDS